MEAKGVLILTRTVFDYSKSVWISRNVVILAFDVGNGLSLLQWQRCSWPSNMNLHYYLQNENRNYFFLLGNDNNSILYQFVCFLYMVKRKCRFAISQDNLKSLI